MSEQRKRPHRWNEAKGKRRWWNPLVIFIWIEWCCEWLAYWLSRWAFISILEHLGKLALVLALVSWLVDIPARKQAQENQRKAKIFQAWQVITTAHGQTGSGGRPLALRDLIDEKESLAEVDLSKATLIMADLSWAKLYKANLCEAVLFGASLSEADLREANLRGTVLIGATLRGTDLSEADLSGARLNKADLSEAVLRGANLSEADLSGADLSDVWLDNADLRGANLDSVTNWRQVRSLDRANVWDVKNAPEGFLAWAIGEKHAVSIENDDEWKAKLQEIGRFDAFRKKLDEEHSDRQ